MPVPELGGLEGVIAKRLAAPYRLGRRAGDSWTKVPLIRTQEVLIPGWKPGQGRREGTIGALLLGVRDDGQLRFAGHVGTGFTDVMLRHLQDQLAPLPRRSSPAPDVPRERARHAHWVEPALVGEVAFRNWTPDGRLRHTSWRGLRPDRSPGEARRQPVAAVAAPAEQVEGALETADGRWRVEVVRRDGHLSCRLLHAENMIEGLDLVAVQRLLAETMSTSRTSRTSPNRRATTPRTGASARRSSIAEYSPTTSGLSHPTVRNTCSPPAFPLATCVTSLFTTPTRPSPDRRDLHTGSRTCHHLRYTIPIHQPWRHKPPGLKTSHMTPSVFAMFRTTRCGAPVNVSRRSGCEDAPGELRPRGTDRPVSSATSG
jgi:hypothetical protein